MGPKREMADAAPGVFLLDDLEVVRTGPRALFDATLEIDGAAPPLTVRA